MALVKKALLLILVTAVGYTAQAVQCRSVLSDPFSQSLVWQLDEQGRHEEADAVREQIEKELYAALPKRWTPHNWTKISTDKNLHKVYLLEARRFRFILKLGEHPYTTEPLAYKIANHLNLRAPVAIPFKIGGEFGVAQYYIENAPSLFAWLDRGHILEANLAVQLFDRLVLNSDRYQNGGNLLSIGIERPAPQEQQVLIDHEFSFDERAPNLWSGVSNAEFISKHKQQIKQDFPMLHKALESLETQAAILGLIQRSNIENKSQMIRHVRDFFALYNRI